MSKSFLNYGTAKGLAYSIDYAGIINQRMQNEMLLAQTKEQARQRAKEQAERINPYDSEVEWITEKLNKDYDSLRQEHKEFMKSNSNWMYTAEGQMKFNEIARKYVDNKWVNIEETSKRNYEMYVNSIGELSKRQIQREQEKYRQYLEGEVEAPYIFDASKPYEINEIITKGVNMVSVKEFEGEDFKVYSKLLDESLDTAVENLILDHKYDILDAWDDHPNQKYYDGNIGNWLKESIRAAILEKEYTDYRAQAALINANRRRQGLSGLTKDWYREEIAPIGDRKTAFNVNNARVNKGWLVAVDGDITDPEEGGPLRNPNDLYLVDKDSQGIPEKISNIFDFKQVWVKNATDAYSMPIEDIGDDVKNEYLKVTAEVNWDPSNLVLHTGDDLTEQQQKENQKVINEIRALNIWIPQKNISTNEMIRMLLEKSRVDDAVSEVINTRTFTVTTWVPMQRYNNSAANFYNNWMDTKTNMRESAIIREYQNLLDGQDIEGYEY